MFQVSVPSPMWVVTQPRGIRRRTNLKGKRKQRLLSIKSSLTMVRQSTMFLICNHLKSRQQMLYRIYWSRTRVRIIPLTISLNNRMCSNPKTRWKIASSEGVRLLRLRQMRRQCSTHLNRNRVRLLRTSYSSHYSVGAALSDRGLTLIRLAGKLFL
jgi:hypothetical protein